ncbi:MAG: S-ribosylhomocysteine lyase [Trueperaceae bacterium]|nr:S-ribosylhomocysteine lyase [Trueperaceae bacterium]
MTVSKTVPKVESFNLDHRKVRAPYVRLAGRYHGPKGDEIRKFDLRLIQPNQGEIPTAALHTIEHLMAGYLRQALGDTVIDASPMGCRTGFYLVALGEPSEADAQHALEHALSAITEHTGPIPGCSEVECGNYRDHSLHGAQTWARDILADKIIIQDTVPIS